MKNLLLIAAFGAGLFACRLAAADYYLDNEIGRDDRAGTKEQPLATFAVLQPRLKPGDTVHLNPTGKPYRQSFVINRLAGTEENPITIDGHGATVSGADPISPDRWEPVGDGVFKVEKFPARVALLLGSEHGAVLLEHLDRDALLSGEWCWAPDEKFLYFAAPKDRDLATMKIIAIDANGAENALDAGKFERSHSTVGAWRYRGLAEITALKIDGAEAPRGWAKDRLALGEWARFAGGVYFRPAADFDFAATPIEGMTRENCFAFHGVARFVKIQNVNAERCYNDGYNLHGNGVKGIVFDGANARQCGDEGVSGHETCEFIYRNATIRECDNGSTHIQDSRSVTQNVTIADCRNNGVEFQLGAAAEHSMENIVLINNRVQMTWSGSAAAPLKIRNVSAITTRSAPTEIRVGAGQTTIENLRCEAPALKFIVAGKIPFALKDAVFAVGKMEWDLRARPFDYLQFTNVTAPLDSRVTDAGKNAIPLAEAGISGINAPAAPIADGAAASAEEIPLAEIIATAIAAGEKTITLAPREYRLTETLILKNLADVTLDGAGAKIVMTVYDTAARLENCRNVTIKNLSLDYDPLPFTQGVITEVGAERKNFAYVIDDGYPELTATFATPRAHLFTADGAAWQADAADLYGENTILDARRGQFELTRAEPALTVGARVAFNLRQKHAFYLLGCGGINFADLTIFTAPSLGFCSRFGEGGDTLTNVRITRGAPPRGATAPRLLSTCADGLNFAYLRRGPQIVNCDFGFMGDDSVNLHAPTFLLVEPSAGADAVSEWYRPYRGENFEAVIRAGDAARILDAQNYRVLATAKIAKFERSTREYADADREKFFADKPGAGQGYAVTLTDLIGADGGAAPTLAAGMLVDVPAAGAGGYEISNSYFHDHRGRGLRIMASDGVIFGNRLERIKHAAITVGAEYGFWREAGWVNNVLVSGNVIREVGRGMIALNDSYAGGAISVFARLENYADAARGNRDITITGNLVDGCPGAGIFVYAAERVTLAENILRRVATAPTAPGATLGFADLAPIWLTNVGAVIERDNQVE